MSTEKLVFQNQLISTIKFNYSDDLNTLEFTDKENYFKIDLQKISNKELKQFHVPTFLICYDKNIILHARHPIFIAQIIDSDIHIIKEITDCKKNISKITTIYKRMKDWLFAYLKLIR